MIPTKNKQFPGIICPHCGSGLDIEECCDLADGRFMWQPDEQYVTTCPVCDKDMIIDVRWEPIYGEARKVER